ncbi:MAG: SurA N-terminal domain-containing protein [Candidatus Dormibacteraeota bacterium]|nr:SurA N-terminal domain-containing protein [Candidatus Dormibacteraeota bacterium]
MKALRSPFTIVLLALALTGCGSSGAAGASAGGSALTVNGTPVSPALYQTLVRSQERALQSQGQPVDLTSASGKRQLADIQARAIRTLARDSIIDQLARERRLAITDSELSAAVTRIETALGGAAPLAAQLDKAGLSRTEFRTFFRYRLLEEKLRQAFGARYDAALAHAVASARVTAYVGPCQTEHQYPRCVGGG